MGTLKSEVCFQELLSWRVVTYQSECEGNVVILSRFSSGPECPVFPTLLLSHRQTRPDQGGSSALQLHGHIGNACWSGGEGRVASSSTGGGGGSERLGDPLSQDDSASSTCYFREIITQKNVCPASQPAVRISCGVRRLVDIFPQALLAGRLANYCCDGTITHHRVQQCSGILERNIVRSWIVSISYLIDKSGNLEIN